ncbi:phosphatase PAP2 family protein [Arthrobacter sp. P2b]|uniref:phosphatase PAP2 family protein n=1 Tax=Arthrobacter sp. P2b TaxID=1938741 RepID=UPI0009A79949|nr:phosphatase PAP2 family protein [Arthrobacter sp. P2b]SLK12211.1 undecaprenyl-diphosphatase [Arthrobacter sp. P2b]
MSGFIVRCAGILLTLTVLGLVFESVTPLPSTAVPSGGGLVEVLWGGADFVAEIAAQVGWLILPVVVLWLAIRGLSASAVYVAAVAVGMFVLAGGGIVLKSFLTGTSSQGGSVFSSGSIQLAVSLGVLLLVFLPAVPARGRTWTVVGTVPPVIMFEIMRMLAGAVSFGPQLLGWLIGIAWLGATLAAFRRWQQHAGQRTRWWYGLPVQDRTVLVPASAGNPPLPGGRSSALKLAGIWVLIASGVTGAGFLVTGVDSVRRLDQATVEWLAEHRNETWNALADVAGSFGNTPGIVGVLLVAAPLAVAITRRAAPAVFLLVAAVGETALYLISGMIVRRPRPDVDHLSEGLPPTSSFPSGHVAAAVVTYGGLALLLRAWAESRLRDLGLILAPLIVLGIALSRLYWGVHYPTDTAVGLIFGAVWVSVCWRYFKPARGSPKYATHQTNPVAEPPRLEDREVIDHNDEK